MILFLLVIFFVAYLIGSIPSAFLAGKMKGIDIRKVGSGNVGATNALRVLGKPIGYAVFLADFLKGFIAILWALFFMLPECNICAGVSENEELLRLLCSAAGVMVGHIYPVWLGFKGGKGIATAAGVLFWLLPVLVVAAVVWLVVFYTTRYVSLASIALALSLPITASVFAWFGWWSWALVGMVAVLAALAIWSHRTNISRLLAGTESRFEKKTKK